MSALSTSKYIWSKEPSPSRNAFVSFEKTCTLTDAPGTPIELHLFADTRFRLWVNGQFVAYGPGRFVTQHPEYDSYDLAPYLKAGANLIRVEVNYYGCSSYQTMPDGQPGFIAAGGSEDGSIDLATPGDWQARVHGAWDSEAPSFSFAQNPAEICDTRLLEAELADAGKLGSVRVLSAEETPWLSLEPRSAPYPDYAPYKPTEILAAGPLAPSTTYGFQTYLAGYQKGRDGQRWRSFAVWVQSPTEQSVTVGCHWTDLFLNGQAVETTDDTPLGNHGEAVLALSSGWNLVTGKVEILTESWAYLLRLPNGVGLSAHALPDTGCQDVFALSPVATEPVELPGVPTSAGEFSLPGGWTLSDGDLAPLTPARVTAWDTFDRSQATEARGFDQLAEICRFDAAAASWCFIFEREFYGQLILDVEAPEGSILDIAYDDWKRADGAVNLYGSNPFTDAADRFILKGGRQTIEVLNPRGGIYIQVTLRAADGKSGESLCLHDLAVQRRTTINEDVVEGNFQSPDEDFNYAWRAAVNTLQASTDESYSDCPWRERGAYIGDSLVTVALHAMVAKDLSVARRAFTNFGQAALPDGQLACCAPSWLRQPHEDFTYIWILGLRDLWAIDGDTKIVESNWKALQGIWSAPWESHESGLWNASDRRLFIDWGVDPNDREGVANATINLFRYGALQASATLADALGKRDEAARFTQEATEVRDAMLALLWDEKGGCFRPSLDGEGPALHANILALCFGVGPVDRLLAYLKPRLLKNFKQGIEVGQWSGHAELYFLYYVLPRLGELGEVELAEQLVAEHYGFLRELGFATLCECFCRAHRGVGSACHVWSAAGAIYAHRYVLGLRQAEAGCPDRFRLDPRVSSRFKEASGTMAHAKGTISVAWRKGDWGEIHARVEAPAGVEILPVDGVLLETAQSADSVPH